MALKHILSVLGATMVLGCGPEKHDTTTDGDPTATTSDGGTTSPTTGDPSMCGPLGEVVADVEIAWGIPIPPCDLESCMSVRDPTCTVSAIAGAGPITLTLECDHLDLGMATDVVTIDLQPGGALDLAPGAAVSLHYESSGAFEVGGSTSIHIHDGAGLVLGATSGMLFGGFSGNPDWGAKLFAAVVSPLTGTMTNAGCLDDDARNAATLARDDASITVPAGASGLLTADATWRLVVQTAARVPTPDYDDEQIDLAVMRVKP